MAKRRNAKKEKAARNKINARKFRKQTSRYGNRGRRNYNNTDKKETTEENNDSSESTSTTANNN
ncbi:hypothetical protein I4641_16895 [Waterburya agarophytonicola K14]|uniref:Uncharacterized protein n=1 Tax=Waterburya agarophytonicola KI4 TaxID=2874699 RepID=A0A964BSH0_9CYAN|nr:hypothetical protein [Waterburya agarophytonicola]MCC0178650.1 hypothetical protein [Waterburya agarophytonicola KI4]